MSAEKQGRVLIVDNDEDILLALEWTLESEGYDTVVALTDGEILSMVAQGSCDLLVLDDYLSEKDCVDVLAALGQAEVRPMVVITYHRYPCADMRQKLQPLGVSAFINKHARSELVHMVRHLLQPHALSGDALSTMT